MRWPREIRLKKQKLFNSIWFLTMSISINTNIKVIKEIAVY